MTNRFLAGVSFSALVLSALALFAALSAVDNTTTSGSSDTATPISDDEQIGDGETGAGPVATTTAVASPTTAAPTPTTPAVPTVTSVTTEPDEDLPGTPAVFGPAAGTRLGVVGVNHDDFLNIRDVPNGTVTATITIRIANSASGDASLLVRGPGASDHLATVAIDGLVATGRTRDLPTTTWHEVQAGPVTGWASSNYLAPFAPQQRHDVTQEVFLGLGDATEAATLSELAEAVVAQYASTADPVSRIRTVAPPTAFEALAELVVDVVGQPDDSVRGYRLHIYADTAGDWIAASADGNIATDAGPYNLRSVEATTLCYSHRGVSEDGLCN